jgi:hypothetical protein
MEVKFGWLQWEILSPVRLIVYSSARFWGSIQIVTAQRSHYRSALSYRLLKIARKS